MNKNDIKEPLQFDLFSWDKVAEADGFDELCALKFDKAREAFQNILVQDKNHNTAITGIALTYYWQKLFIEKESLSPKNSLEFLWKNIMSYQFHNVYGFNNFRKTLLKKLAEEIITVDPLLYVPDLRLCLGSVYLELKEYDKTANTLFTLIKSIPFEVGILGLYGKSLWLSGREKEARESYAKALLISPSEVIVEDFICEEIIQIIEERGAYMTPIYGWFAYELPLLNITVPEGKDSEHKKALRIYEAILNAENKRAKGNHLEMVSLREKLQKEDENIFRAYMKRINLNS